MTQASFNIYPQLLVVQFTDTSTVEEGRTLASWAWNFGDAGTATTQNPSHTYAAAGKYMVTLTVTDSNGDTLQTIRYIVVATHPILPLSLEDFVKVKLPSNLPYQSGQLSAVISTWQLYVQPLVNTPGVDEIDSFNEAAYPAIVNALIGYLAAYQILLDYVSSAAISAAGSSISGEEGVVKKIETGPSNAEFFNPADWLKTLTQPNGLIEQVRKQLCLLSSRTMIEIPYCPKIPKPVFIPRKAGRNETSFLNLWSLDPSEVILAY